MSRITINMPEEQLQRLREVAAERGCKIAVVLREAVDMACSASSDAKAAQ